MCELEAQRLLQWQWGQTPGPLHVLIFPTFRCNLNCAICARHWKEEPRQFDEELSPERLVQLVDESAAIGTTQWTIGGGGEPLLRAGPLMDLCRRIKGHGMTGALQTNGTLFKAEQIDELVRLGWDSVSISVDGHTAEISDRLRFSGAFEKATWAVREFAAAKRRHGRDKPMVSVACVLSRFNGDYMTQMVESAREWGADSLTFSAMMLYADEMKPLEMTDEQMAHLPRNSQRALARAGELGLTVGVSALPPDKAADAAQTSESANPYRNALCVEPWLTIVILTNGECVPCCVFGYGITGSVKDKSLRDVWLGREFTTIRRMILKGVVMPACNECQGQYVWRRTRVLAALERHQAFRVGPAALARKAFASLRRHGIKTAIRRAGEWIVLRRKYGRN